MTDKVQKQLNVQQILLAFALSTNCANFILEATTLVYLRSRQKKEGKNIYKVPVVCLSICLLATIGDLLYLVALYKQNQ